MKTTQHNEGTMKQNDTDRIVKAIRANVDAYYADEISYEAFGARQRDLWDEAASCGVNDAVMNIIANNK